MVIAQSSQTKIDDYVYAGSGSKLLFRFAKGSFRAVTGKIVQQNPQGFNMQTPLATLGVRGSDVFALVQPGVEDIGALELGSGHTLELSGPLGQSSITSGGQFCRATPEGFTLPQPIPPILLNSIREALSSPAAPPVPGPAPAPSGSGGGSPQPVVSTTPQLPVITPTVTPTPAPATPHAPYTPPHTAS